MYFESTSPFVRSIPVSYVGACSIACGVAFGFGKWSNKIAESGRFSPTVTKLIQRVSSLATSFCVRFGLFIALLVFEDFSSYHLPLLH